MTPAGIEPATFRFVAQHLNHSVTAVPNLRYVFRKITNIPTIYTTLITPQLHIPVGTPM